MSILRLIFLLILSTITTTISQHEVILFQSDFLLETGDACITINNGVEVNGICMPIQNCPLVLASVIDQKKTDYTVCGYNGKTQIICCPSMEKLNLKDNLDCVVANSNKTGIIKFFSDCPQLQGQDAGPHINKLCMDEICSDLVCCPGRLQGRLKDACWNVDHPIQTLILRLNLHQECTVKGLNIKGRYQQNCAFAERNPTLKSILQNVCSDDKCKDWYCCPIEDVDNFECVLFFVSNTVLVGPKCTDSKSGRKGKCRTSYNCAHPDVKTLDKCGTYCCTDYYCCPDADLVATSEQISTRECDSYIKYLYKTEIEVPMNLYLNRTKCVGGGGAAGGVIARPGEYPHMAALGYKPEDEILWKCGGSLISDRYVLTAGHCLADRKLGSVVRVRLGVVDLLNDVNTADCPEDFDVANIILHPEYDPKFVYNDIGLIELARSATFNFHIRPICLPSNADDEQYFLSMGWGTTGTAEEASVKLIIVDQELFTNEECRKQYDVNRRYPNGIMNDIHICAGSRDDIQSTCPGDSGGPLVAVHKTNYKLLNIYGIVSFGTPCGFANSPGVYTRVFPYVKWIEATVWKN